MRPDNTYSNGLTHVANSETAKRSVVGERLNTHWFLWDHANDTSFTLLQEFWVFFQDFTGTTVHLLFQNDEFTSDVRGVAIQNWCVTGTDLTRVVGNDNLCLEILYVLWRVGLGVPADVSTSYFLDGNVLNVETNVVSWHSLFQGFVVHFYGLDFGFYHRWGEDNLHASLDLSGLNTAYWNRTDTTDLVNILQWKTKWLVGWALWWLYLVQSFDQAVTLVPWHILGLVQHIVAHPAGDWDERDLLWLVTYGLQEAGHFAFDFLVTGFFVSNGLVVHLVDGNDHLLYTQSVGQQTVLSGLSILGEGTFETPLVGWDDQDGNIGLGGTGDHVLDEVTVSWSIDDGEVELVGFEFPKQYRW